jgi:hypothetical protein
MNQPENAVDRFNAMIDDYNARCSNYRYKPTDFQRAGSEVKPDRDILFAAGRERAFDTAIDQSTIANMSVDLVNCQT